MPQGERNGDSLNTLFKKISGCILLYVLDYYHDTTRQDVNDLKKQGIHNSPTYTYQGLLDADALKMQGIHNLPRQLYN